MAKCCGDSCVCRLTTIDDHLSNAPLVVTGTGTQQDPFVIQFLGVDVDASPSDVELSVDFTADGYVLSAAFSATSKLDNLGDVNAPAPSNGYVLAWNSGTSKWVAVAPTTASAGAVTTDTSLAGDGSSGDPLGVNFATNGGLEDTGTGTKLTGDVFNELVRRFADSTARTSASPAPVLNSLSMLDTAPGLVDWWTGTAWSPLIRLVGVDGTEYLNLSGAYADGPIQIIVRQISLSTDTGGAFVALDTTDLTGFAGVLAVTVQPTGTVGWFAMLDTAPTGGQVTGTAWAGDGSGLLISSAITAIVTAHVY